MDPVVFGHGSSSDGASEEVSPARAVARSFTRRASAHTSLAMIVGMGCVPHVSPPSPFMARPPTSAVALRRFGAQ